MEHRHLTADEPEWLVILGRLAHDFYHRPEYCRLDGEPQQTETGAFWAGEGDRELFIPYLLRQCASLFPGEVAATGARDVISPYGYPGLLLNDSARQSPDFAQRAMQRLGETLRERVQFHAKAWGDWFQCSHGAPNWPLAAARQRPTRFTSDVVQANARLFLTA